VLMIDEAIDMITGLLTQYQGQARWGLYRGIRWRSHHLLFPTLVPYQWITLALARVIICCRKRRADLRNRGGVRGPDRVVAQEQRGAGGALPREAGVSRVGPGHVRPVHHAAGKPRLLMMMYDDDNDEMMMMTTTTTMMMMMMMMSKRGLG
jgi:hypothetical protein